MTDDSMCSCIHIIDLVTHHQATTMQPDSDAVVQLAGFQATRTVENQLIHDCTSELLQFYVQQPLSVDNYRRVVAALPELPTGDATRIIFVSSNCDFTEFCGMLGLLEETYAAADLRAGQAYGSTDARFLFVLTRPEDEDKTAAILYSSVRAAEVFRHKVERQFVEYESIRSGLEANRGKLQAAAELLAIRLQTLDAHTDSASLKAVLESRRALSAAYQGALSFVAEASRMRASLQANVANVESFLRMAGTGSLFENRLAKCTARVGQITNDLQSNQPAMDLAIYVSKLHSDTLLTTLNVSEVTENRTREAESRRHRRTESWFAAVAIWLGLSQLWGTAVTTRTGDESPWSLFGTLVVPSAILFVLVAVAFRTTARFQNREAERVTAN